MLCCMDEARRTISVVGAGVLGLSICQQLRETLPDADITLMAPSLGQAPPHALWELPPYRVTPPARAIRWAWATREYFLNECNVEHRLVRACRSIFVARHPRSLEVYESSLRRVLPSFTSGAAALEEFCAHTHRSSPAPYTCAVAYDAFVIDSRALLRHMIGALQRSKPGRGDFRWSRTTVHTLTDVAQRCDCVVNCTGMGARVLCGDKNVVPIRGQVVEVRSNLPVAVSELDGNAYVIPSPRSDELTGQWEHLVECGGTAEERCDVKVVEQKHTTSILAMCDDIVQGIATNVQEDVWVGIRPYRASGARVERDSSTRNIVHAYGLGGSGFTCSRGVAADATELVLKVLQRSML